MIPRFQYFRRIATRPIGIDRTDGKDGFLSCIFFMHVLFVREPSLSSVQRYVGMIGSTASDDR